MNWLDVVIVVILVIPMLIGFKRGLINTVIPLAGVILGIVLAGRLRGTVADWLSTWINSSSQAEIVAFIIIFVVVIVATLVLAGVLRGFVRLLFLGWVDKLGGLAFGFALGGMISAALLAVLAKFPFWDIETTIGDSSLAAFFLDKFPFVLRLLPGEFDSVRQFFG